MVLSHCNRLIWPCEWWKTTCETVDIMWSDRWNNHFWLMLLSWQMLLPFRLERSGRCNCHIGWRGRQMLLPLWQMLLPLGHYLSFSSVLLIRTSSHIWGRWYLPMFLLRDGLLTLMNIDSFISLERFCSSLPTILKLFKVMLWPEML